MEMLKTPMPLLYTSAMMTWMSWFIESGSTGATVVRSCSSVMDV